ncbi:SIMPL domain-containing protein [Natronorubrum tibetense]|uniref:SIMPL domain-containing protein n=1 Tax=Natronorubrum tibetense GA33 TaxID=1114856 RepID=L9VRG7_9EURY|nr:SIMPL domain-containing protein [Natronorubrum tibetense]ELY39805.1 hypothetical protein C496_14046 [Natronorubrum tibetense GA33]
MAERSITVLGDGSVQFRPERSEIRFQTSGGGDLPTDAYQTVADRTMALRQSLLDHGCDRSQFETIECTVKHRSNQFDPAPDDLPYCAKETLVLCCRSEKVRDRLVPGLEAGADVLEIQTALSDERRSELRSAALTRATSDAREHAEAIADAEGVELGDLIEISERSPDGMQSLVDEALEYSATDNIVPGPVEINARVTASYEITEP